MRLSGPVDAVKLLFQGREYLLLSDRHNSVHGSCPGLCADISTDNKPIPGQDACESIVHFLHRHLRQGADLFLEASFVLQDAPRPVLAPSVRDGLQSFHYGDSKEDSFAEFDYIDRMLYVFHDSFLRNKKGSQYPQSFLHYVDIRDLFLGTYKESGAREMISANPFSGSIVVRAFRDCRTVRAYEQVYKEGLVLVRYILDQAWSYFGAYLDGKQAPVPNHKGPLFDTFRERLAKRELLTSTWQGEKVFRVRKQLLKLPGPLQAKIRAWAEESFRQELQTSETFFQEWQTRTEALFKIELPLDLFLIKFEPVRMHPISCLVALSSILMDVYLLARAFYHQHTPLTIFYCGAAHIENHLAFFKQYGAQIISESRAQSERCLVLP